MDATPVSALEMAVDMHSTIVMALRGIKDVSNGYGEAGSSNLQLTPIPMSCTREQHRNHLELILILPESKLPCIKIF